ncbi:MAG: hypothetical protein II923_02495, partial [Campylobacter sp.]|nr:hypothetical protein [Campylobacter sp.]
STVIARIFAKAKIRGNRQILNSKICKFVEFKEFKKNQPNFNRNKFAKNQILNLITGDCSLKLRFSRNDNGNEICKFKF